MGICARGDKSEVASRSQLQNFRQRNLLVVFVGGVVLEKDDALTVQTPVVPLSLLGIEVGWDVEG